jgi:hypothetical protein
MDDIDMVSLKNRINDTLPVLNEFQRRRFLAAEAKAIGRGGISLICRMFGVSPDTIRKGIREINAADSPIPARGRSRKAGGGRKLAVENQPGILETLKELFSLQANKKTLSAKPSHPDRNEQFEYINSETAAANSEGCPVLSVDAKKKENIGNFKNNETAAFAVASIRSWWYSEGCIEYAAAPEIVITADCGGGDGNRNRLWKCCLQELADEIEKPIRVLHYPPGTSKWNKTEHRLFSFISKNRQAQGVGAFWAGWFGFAE